MNSTIGKIWFNTTIFYCIAGLCTIVLHEVAHAVVGMLYATKPVLYHNHVNLMETRILPFPHIMIAMAGPLFSLMQGLLGYKWLRERLVNDKKALFLLYFSLFGFTTFFGYLMTAPFMTWGDIGLVCEILDLPTWTRFSFFIMGMIALVITAYKYAPLFARFIPNDTIYNDKDQRPMTLYALTIFAWFSASAILSLASMPDNLFVVISIPLSNMVIWLIFALSLKQGRSTIQEGTDWIVNPYILGGIIVVALIAVFRVLRMGIPLY